MLEVLYDIATKEVRAWNADMLSHSPDVLTPVEMGETLRIFGKKLGYKFD